MPSIRPSRLLPALLLAAVPLGAQEADPAPIEVGASAAGVLNADAPRLSYRGPFTVFRFEAEEGVRYSAELASEDFDTYLILARPVGGLTEFLREDDDGAGGTDARLRFQAERSESLLLVVQSWSESGSGAFTLSLERRPEPPPLEARPLPADGIVTGRLDERSAAVLLYEQEIPADLWTFEGRGGEMVRIALDSQDFDAYLEFGAMSGGTLQITNENDDGGDGRNALLRVELPHDGTYGVRVRPLSEGGEGAYRLEARPFEPGSLVVRTIAIGERAEATLTLEDPVLDGGIPFHEWTFEGTAGERVRISMRSSELDSYLLLGRSGVDGGFETLAFNDDGPDGLDSEIDFTLPETGSYRIRTRPLQGSAQGTYTLEILGAP